MNEKRNLPEFDVQAYSIEEWDIIKEWIKNRDILRFSIILSSLQVRIPPYLIEEFFDEVEKNPKMVDWIVDDFVNKMIHDHHPDTSTPARL